MLRTRHHRRARPTQPVTRGRLLGAGVVALALAGCSAEALTERALEAISGAEDVTVNDDGEVVAFETEDGTRMETGEDGSFTFEEGEDRVTSIPTDQVPPEVAAVLALPAEVTATQAIEVEQDGDRIVMVQGELVGDPDAVFDTLASQVEAAGYDQVERSDLGLIRMVIGENEDGTGISVSVTADEGADQGLVQIMVSGE